MNSAPTVLPNRLSFLRYADMRYRGQEHSVKVDLSDGVIGADIIAQTIDQFHDAHEREYSFRLSVPVELVNFHVAGVAIAPKPDLPRIEAAGRTAAVALASTRRVDFDEDGIYDTPIYARERLPVDFAIDGPAIIEEPASTTIVLPGQSAAMDAFGNIRIVTTAQGRGAEHEPS